jgi:hypothetical protein
MPSGIRGFSWTTPTSSTYVTLPRWRIRVDSLGSNGILQLRRRECILYPLIRTCPPCKSRFYHDWSSRACFHFSKSCMYSGISTAVR